MLRMPACTSRYAALPAVKAHLDYSLGRPACSSVGRAGCLLAVARQGLAASQAGSWRRWCCCEAWEHARLWRRRRGASSRPAGRGCQQGFIHQAGAAPTLRPQHPGAPAHHEQQSRPRGALVQVSTGHASAGSLAAWHKYLHAPSIPCVPAERPAGGPMQLGRPSAPACQPSGAPRALPLPQRALSAARLDAHPDSVVCGHPTVGVCHLPLHRHASSPVCGQR